MALRDFLPSNDAELREWLGTFQTNFPTVANQLGLTAAEISEIEGITNVFIEDIDAQAQQEQLLKSIIETKVSNREDKLPIFRAAIANLKNRRNYQKSMGELLGVISRPRPKLDYDTLQPKPKLQVVANEVKITFTRGNTHGVNIYCRRGNETNFTLMVRSYSSPFVDNRPNLNGASSERREYYLRYMRGNVEVGQNSDIVVVNV